jgi:hypothetical protein
VRLNILGMFQKSNRSTHCNETKTGMKEVDTMVLAVLRFEGRDFNIEKLQALLPQYTTGQIRKSLDNLRREGKVRRVNTVKGPGTLYEEYYYYRERKNE